MEEERAGGAAGSGDAGAGRPPTPPSGGLLPDGGRGEDDGPYRPFDDDEEAGLSTGFLDQHGYLAWLGVHLEEAGHGWVRMRIPYDEKLLNPGTGGTVHGGVAATLVDTSSAFALRTTFEDPSDASLATTDLHVNYLRPARDDLVAEAEVVRAGGSIGVTDVTVTSTTPEGEEKAVVVGRTTYRLFR